MSEQGGQSYDTLYKCVCLVDAIAAEMTHDEFVEAQVFSQLRSTAGERGGVFRDPDQARSLVAKLEAAIEHGKAQCFIRNHRKSRSDSYFLSGGSELGRAADKSLARHPISSQ